MDFKKITFLLITVSVITMLFTSCSGGGSVSSGSSGNLVLTIKAHFEPDPYYYQAIKIFINGSAVSEWFFYETKTFSVKKGDRLTALVDLSASDEFGPWDANIVSAKGTSFQYTIDDSIVFEFFPDIVLVEEGVSPYGS